MSEIFIKIAAALTLSASPLVAQLIAPPAEPNAPITPLVKSDPKNIYSSVVRIEAATQVPDYTTPWSAGRFSGGIGTGFIIGENQILTNAHVVSNARRLLVTMHGSARKHPAKIKYIAHDCDLALLELEDFKPFAHLQHLEIGDMPKLEDQVRVIGYPVGGDRISITRGVVSRIDFRPYSHSQVDSHLVVQIDAAINPGNSGGPVLQDGKVVGVAFQGLRSADNTGYIIPTPVIERFLTDIKTGSYDHYVELGLVDFPLHNPAMRRKFNLKADDPGVLVAAVTPDGSCEGILEVGDILVAIDGNQVDSAGNILISGEKVNLNEIAERKFDGDEVKLSILRNGQAMEKTIVLKPFPPARMYAATYDQQPLFTTFSGLVFQPLNLNLYAASKFSNARLRRLYARYIDEAIFKERKDIVVLTRILNDPINAHLGSHAGLAVESINGEKVRDIEHAHQLLHPAEMPEFFIIKCEGNPRPIIIPGDEAAEASQRTLTRYGVSKSHNLKH
ncbi:S1C family serine protease [Persicirhabdus sediminis]|uniref:Trypsin-like peptidase domain-containing protein n=1 Tax=Persicirhabdus sediminis TaxID=454144 RepID=A0A8J7MEG0_9BACT|nr:S1C family serine protease [Persicirhabdus sediminis]MBK1791180.1 trypsin-like peptidase domain-containing protein [Persicirhabdus sediminis]